MPKLFLVTREIIMSAYVLAEDEEDAINLASTISDDSNVEEKIGELTPKLVTNVPQMDLDKNLISRDKVIRTLREYMVLETKPVRFMVGIPKKEEGK